jgi:NAD(P)-dependent dehydrogenase (short-subunit alcohol dehydrogenase family)
MPIALITGASSGLGRALALALAEQGWRLIIDARDPRNLYRASDLLAEHSTVTAVSGDVSVPAHRADLARAVDAHGTLDLVVNNASMLGPSPLRALHELEAAQFSEILQVNVLAPLALIQAVLPRLTPAAAVVNISSDAAIEHYPGWGGYGASKAALDHLTLTLAAEHPALDWYAVDPGDMRTPMHQAAFPGEDISDRPEPETVVPALLNLLASRPVSGRYRLSDWRGQQAGEEAADRQSPILDRVRP